MDGQPRIQGAHVDIGADESDGTTWTFTPVVIRVKPTGNDANDGSTWALAKKTVQAGANAASLSGGEVWVAGGTYNERIVLPAYAYICGGFAGTETSKGERSWTTNATILDGQNGGSVVWANGCGSASGVDGFTIRNGKAVDGGGVYCGYASPTIANNTISGNSTMSGSGGGICCICSFATISNNTIVGNNSVDDGGGVYCAISSLTVTGNTIKGNVTSSDGGGIYLTSSAGTISGNLFSGNNGAIFSYQCSPAITNNTISGNASGVTSYCGGRPLIAGNIISGNGGGGILCSQAGSPYIINNTVTHNGCYGVDIYGASPSVSNNILAFNASGIRTSLVTDAPVLSNNCVYNPGGTNYYGLSAGVGDISVDPKLVAVEYGQVHIQPDSPCRDAGLDSAVGVGWTDIDGQPRIQGAHVDIGADESDGTTWAFTPVVVRVKPTGNNASDGSTWALAKRTVQAAVNAASQAGGEEWVAAGTYYENVVLSPYAYLYGGFAATETSRSQRNWSLNATVLNAQHSDSIVVASSVGKASRIDGFTIRGGSAENGGGIYCGLSAPAITNNTITGNTASSCGGGVYCREVLLSNNIITGNTADYGGGVYSSSSVLSNNTITGNSASSSGAGVYSYSDTVVSNVVTGNSAGSYGGGIYCASSSSPTLSNNTIVGNSASLQGGAISLDVCLTCSVSNNIVAWNSSGLHSSSTGNSASTFVLRNNCIYNPDGYNYWNLSQGTGDITVDPGFVDRAWGDYHITLSSPCANAGWDLAPGMPSVDLDGLSRIYGGRVDMGAYEAHFEAVAKPVFTPGTGSYCPPLAVTISCPTDGAVIRCTTDGSRPTETSMIAHGQVMVTQACTIAARAWKDGMYISPVSTAVYTMLPGENAVAYIKTKALNAAASTECSAITCRVNKDFFYIESDDRSSGIMVFKLNHGMQVGMRAKIAGTMGVTGVEKYIKATSITQNGTGTVRPLTISNRDIGGSDWQYNSSTKAGQVGVKEYRLKKIGDTWTPTLVAAVGTNNIGLLVTTTGKVTYSTAGMFYIDDGSGLMDASNYTAAYKGIRIIGAVPVPTGVDPVGKLAKVTGAVSCFNVSGNGFRQVYARDVEILQ